MARKLPADFNAGWYRAAYPDVALSGIDPRDHYLRFGRRLNRPPNGKALPDTRTPVPAAAKPLEARKTPAATKPTSPPKGPIQSAPADRFSAIVARPKDFKPEDVRPTPAPPREGLGSSGILSLDSLFEEGVWASLLAYAGMMRLPLPGEAAANEPSSSLFHRGETRIENAWHTGESKLRLAIAGATDVQSSGRRWILRAYQADPASPGDLLSAGEGLQFPPQGPIFHDVELRHPLMPLLLELSDGEGVTHEFRLVAFPSLLPGGLHAAELRALQAEADPMNSFWLLSDALLQEFVNRQNTSDRSVVVLNVEDGCLSSDVQEWLAAIGLASDQGTAEDDTRPRIMLPKNSLPTLSALFSRRLDLTQSDPAIGSYLVADIETLRPLWSVVLPSKHGAVERPFVPLAISMRHRAEVSEMGVSLPSDIAWPALTVLLEASDADRTKAVLVALRKAAGDAELEFIVRLPVEDRGISEVIDEICDAGAWKPLPAGSQLLDVAREARHEVLLTIDDRVRLDDPNTVAALCSMLRKEGSAASVSCVLIGEKVVKKHAVLQRTIGGLFPAGWSFAAAPHLTFTEPDVIEALSGQTYPVVANNFHLTVWRTALLAGLAESDSLASERVADLRIGLDLLLAGYTNLCTTQVQAGFTGQIVRRDLIDPFGATGIPPHRAGDLLSRVTLLRDLS